MASIRTLCPTDARRVEAGYHFPTLSAVSETIMDVVKGLTTVYHVQCLNCLSHLASTSPSTSTVHVALRSVASDEAVRVRMPDTSVTVERRVRVQACAKTADGAIDAPKVTLSSGPVSSSRTLPSWLDLTELDLLAAVTESVSLSITLSRTVPGESSAGESKTAAPPSPTSPSAPHTLLSVRWLQGVRAVGDVAASPHFLDDHLLLGDNVVQGVVPLQLSVICNTVGIFYCLPVRQKPFCVSGGKATEAAHARVRRTEQHAIQQVCFREALVSMIAPLYLAQTGSSARPEPSRVRLVMNDGGQSEVLSCQTREGQSRVLHLLQGLRHTRVDCASEGVALRDATPFTTYGERLSLHVVRAFFPCLRFSTQLGRVLHEVTVVPGRFTVLFWSRGFLERHCAVTRVGPRSRRAQSADRRQLDDAYRAGELRSEGCLNSPTPLLIVSRVPDAILETPALRAGRCRDHRRRKSRDDVSTAAVCVQSSSAFGYAVNETHAAYHIVRRYFSVYPFLILVDAGVLETTVPCQRSGSRMDKPSSHRDDFESYFAEAVARFHSDHPHSVQPTEAVHKESRASESVPSRSVRVTADTRSDSKRVEIPRGPVRSDVVCTDQLGAASVTSTVVARMRKGSLIQPRHEASNTNQSRNDGTYNTTPVATAAAVAAPATSTLRFEYLLRSLSAARSGQFDAPHRVSRFTEASARRAAAAALAKMSSGVASHNLSKPRRTPVVLCNKGKGLRTLAKVPSLALTGCLDRDLADLRHLLGSSALNATHSRGYRHAVDERAAGVPHDTRADTSPVVDWDVIETWAQDWRTLVQPGFASPRAWMPETQESSQEESGCPLIQHTRLVPARVHQWARKFLVIVMPVQSVPSPPSASEAFAWELHQRRLASASAPSSAFSAAAVPSRLPRVKQAMEWWLADQHAVHERVRLEWFLTFAEAYVYHPEMDMRRSGSSVADTRSPSHIPDETGAALVNRIASVRRLVARVYREDPPDAAAAPVWVREATPLPDDLIESVTALEPILLTWGWRFAHLTTSSLSDTVDITRRGANEAARAHVRRCVAITQWPRLTVESIDLTLRTMQDLRWMVDDLSSAHAEAPGHLRRDRGFHEGDLTDKGNRDGAVSLIVPSAVLQFLISRSCRGAIMFGDAVTTNAARTLVEAMRTAVQYYVCSHGRACLSKLAPLRTC